MYCLSIAVAAIWEVQMASGFSMASQRTSRALHKSSQLSAAPTVVEPSLVSVYSAKDTNGLEIEPKRAAKASDVPTDHPRRRMAKPKNRRSNSRIEATTSFSRKNGKAKANQLALLTKEEEYDYTFKLRALREAVRHRDELSAKVRTVEGKVLHEPTEEEWAKACSVTVPELRRIMQEGQFARSMLVNANVGLVTTFAKKYASALKRGQASGSVGTVLTLQDLIQEGNIGLMEAAERFEPERNFRFSTYASYWIRQRMLGAISDYSRIIRLPAHGKCLPLFLF